MRLAKIKIAGFKSFVDPTTIDFPSNLVGIVGPNGCGKSNVIDAVRWVMGESSAKHLRGDSMEDVIFNGSSARKPVGTAAIELMFDNSDGSVGGQYAKYSEISVKRILSRDGTSNYYLNNTRCRRKDITHLFLGTGLGPRSYAIIEQGMISRLIEARPEEMRVYLEEAAGISKYKDRRRETENRISHTRENLERLHDLRDEVDKQIKHLQRQARVAERFKELKEEERRSTAELLALRLAAMDEAVRERKQAVSERENKLQACIAAQRATESGIEKTRESHAEQSDRFNEVQGAYYKVGAEIARLEQSIQHAQEMRERQAADLEQAVQGLGDIQAHIEKDQVQIVELENALKDLEPTFDRAQNSLRSSAIELEEARSAMQGWQQRSDEHGQSVSEMQQQSQVERTKLEHMEGQLARYQAQCGRVEQEMGRTDAAPLQSKLSRLQELFSRQRQELEGLEQERSQTGQRLAELRSEEHSLSESRDRLRHEIRSDSGRLSSLEALQQAALGKNEQTTSALLDRHGLGSVSRLAQQLTVTEGWELAVETALGEYLEALYVEDMARVSPWLDELEKGHLTVFDRGGAIASAAPVSGTGSRLSDMVRGEPDMKSLLGSIRVAESLDEALSLRGTLVAGQSVMTREGIWVGPNWLRVSRGEDSHAGVFQREIELRELSERIENRMQMSRDVEQQLNSVRDQLDELDRRREESQARQNVLHREQSRLNGEIEACRSTIEQTSRQKQRLQSEFDELAGQIEMLRELVSEARGRQQLAVEGLAELQAERESLDAEKSALLERLQRAQQAADADREIAQEIQIKIESRRSTRENALSGLDRMKSQLARFEERRSSLQQQLLNAEQPIAEQREELQGKLHGRIEIQEKLAQARRDLEEVETGLRELEQQRADQELAVGASREALEQAKMSAQEIVLRREALEEQFAKTDFDLAVINNEMPEEASIEDWQQKLGNIEGRIGRLGPINLAAIDEFKEQSERKEYLDAQYNDLVEALQTLENAIKKIDRETRTRFKETFERVNAGLKQNFPRLFGGGHAYLELSDEDLLSAGVTIMARPPGKRNSNIHLLSGGEKALTAVALVFAIFQLNPAPFCLLDEVDAPLDDANVGRFCDIVREMSDQVQFVFITHNKVTMEMANQLTGVTMQEPGVSRLVAVDVQEAVQMAAM